MQNIYDFECGGISITSMPIIPLMSDKVLLVLGILNTSMFSTDEVQDQISSANRTNRTKGPKPISLNLKTKVYLYFVPQL